MQGLAFAAAGFFFFLISLQEEVNERIKMGLEKKKILKGVICLRLLNVKHYFTDNSQ